MKEFDTLMRQALTERVRDVEPSHDLLKKIRTEAEERRKENGFMKFNMKKMVTAAAAICALSVTCYAAGHLGGVLSSGTNNIRTFAGMEKAEKKLGFDARYVETFANGMTFQHGGTGETQGQDEDGNPMGETYKTMTVSYADEKGNSVTLLIDGGSPYADAGVETTEGYSKDTFLFLPNEDALTEEYKAMQDAGEIYISYGTAEEEWNVMENYSWEEDGVYYSLTAADCGLGEEELAAMAAEIMAE
ncbi:hypothetical protein [Anaerotignum sp.]